MDYDELKAEKARIEEKYASATRKATFYGSLKLESAEVITKLEGEMLKYGSLFKFNTSLKFPIRFVAKFRTISETESSNPIPILSIFLPARLTISSRLSELNP